MWHIDLHAAVHPEPTVHFTKKSGGGDDENLSTAIAPSSVTPPETTGFPTSPATGEPSGMLQRLKTSNSTPPPRPPPPKSRPEANSGTVRPPDQNNAAAQAHTSDESSAGGSSGAPATNPHTLTLAEARQLLVREGLDFKIPPFLKERPPLPSSLQGLDAEQLAARLDDMPDGEDRAAVQKYLAWKAQDDGYQALVDRHTTAIAKMIQSGERKDHVMEAYDGYKRIQKLQRDAIQVTRHARENGVFSLSTQGMDYLRKSQFQWKRMRFGKNPKDVKSIEEIEQKKKDYETELAQLSNNRPISMLMLRTEHTHRQKMLNDEIKKAVDDKLHRLGEHSRRRYFATPIIAFAVGTGTATMYWERIIGVGGAAKGENKDEQKKHGKADT